jgi:hypothetical protein
MLSFVNLKAVSSAFVWFRNQIAPYHDISESITQKFCCILILFKTVIPSFSSSLIIFSCVFFLAPWILCGAKITTILSILLFLISLVVCFNYFSIDNIVKELPALKQIASQ